MNRPLDRHDRAATGSRLRGSRSVDADRPTIQPAGRGAPEPDDEGAAGILPRLLAESHAARRGAAASAPAAASVLGPWLLQRQVDRIEGVTIAEAYHCATRQAARLALTPSAATAERIRGCIKRAVDDPVMETGGDTDAADGPPCGCSDGVHWVRLPKPAGTPLGELIAALGPPPQVVVRDWQLQLSGRAARTRLERGTEPYWNTDRLMVDAANRLGLRDQPVVVALLTPVEVGGRGRAEEDEQDDEHELDSWPAVENELRTTERPSARRTEDAGAARGAFATAAAIGRQRRDSRRRSRYRVGVAATIAVAGLASLVLMRTPTASKQDAADETRVQETLSQPFAAAGPAAAEEPLELERLDAASEFELAQAATGEPLESGTDVNLDSLLLDPAALLSPVQNPTGEATQPNGDEAVERVAPMPRRDAGKRGAPEAGDPGNDSGNGEMADLGATPSEPGPIEATGDDADRDAMQRMAAHAGAPFDLRAGRSERILELGEVPERRSLLRIGCDPPEGLRVLGAGEQTARLRRGRFEFWFVTKDSGTAEETRPAGDADGTEPQYGVLARIDVSGGRDLELRCTAFVQLDPLTPPLAWHQDAAQQWGDRLAAAIGTAEAMVQTLRVRREAIRSSDARNRVRQHQALVQQHAERLQRTGRRLASAATMIERLSREARWQLSLEPPAGSDGRVQPRQWTLSAAEGAPE